jgi:argininosuccinate synthase
MTWLGALIKEEKEKINIQYFKTEKMKKVVLAFSGGLDTSYCAKYLSDVKKMEVHTVTINTGGFTDAELNEITQKAKALGVASHKTLKLPRVIISSA